MLARNRSSCSPIVGEKKLRWTERKVGALKEELESLHRCRGKVFQVPPIEWIQERLTKLKEILERNSDRSGLLLRKLLGPLRLQPTCVGDTDRSFYKATTSLNTLALLDPLMEGEERESGSNSLQWWSRWDSNPRPPRCHRGALPTAPRPHREENSILAQPLTRTYIRPD